MLVSIERQFSIIMENNLDLTPIKCPLFVEVGSGDQDGLNGEKSVKFESVANGKTYEVVHSLAKWKRKILSKSIFRGIICDMKAIRAGEPELDWCHSMQVEQWDWEAIACPTFETLVTYVKNIWNCIVEFARCYDVVLQDTIEFIPSSDPRSELELVKEYKVVFLHGIVRAPDYDDWSLNGDILVLHKDKVLELSSMGIRVTPEVLRKQMPDPNTKWHRDLLDGKFPQTIGGGIGKDRLLMYVFNLDHIDDVQEYSI